MIVLSRHPDCSLKHLIAGDHDNGDDDDHDSDGGGGECYG